MSGLPLSVRRSLVLIALATTAMPALAQEADEFADGEEVQFDALPEDEGRQPIIVTASGLAAAQSEVAFNTVTLENADIAREPSGRLENVLTGIAGFQLFRASDARSGHPTGQGATLRGLGGNASSRALLILDGVPQSDPFGGWITWPAFDASRLGAVRVTRGGGSGVYGVGALAGTIEMESLSAENFQPASAQIAHGSRDAQENHFGVMLPPAENSLLDISGFYARGDGFIPVIESQRGPIDEPARYENYGGTFRIAAPLGQTEFQFAGRYFYDRRSRGFAFGDNRTDGFDGSLRLIGRGATQWEALAYVQTRDLRSSFASVDAARTTATQVLDQFSVPATGFGGRFEIRPALAGDAAELRLGGDMRQTEGRTRERFFFIDGAPTRQREAGGRTRTAGLFADGTLRAAPALTLTGSARLDHWWIEDGAFRQSDIGVPLATTETYPDREGWRFTGRAGLAWRPTNPLTIRAAGYTGWRLPTLNELYRPFRVGNDVTAANAALDPEDLTGIEAGIDYTPASILRLSGTVFYNRLDDAIANVTLGQGPGQFPGAGFVPAGGLYIQRRNLDGIDAAGIELDALARFAEWSVRFSYAYTDAEVVASGAAAALDGLRPAQVARHNGSVTLAFAKEFGPEASFTARYLGSRFEDDLNTQRLNDALIFGARIAYPIYGPLEIELRAENIFGVRVEAGLSNDGIIERAMPRSLWAGLRFAFF